MSVRRLAGLLRPDGPRGALPVDGPGWDELLALAAAHRLLPALWSSLHGSGLLPDVPASLRAATAHRLGPTRELPAVVLADAHARNAARVEDLLAQAATVLGALEGAGIAAAPMKGVDAQWRGRYPDPAARAMTDIDLLVDPARAREADTIVRDLGYEEAEAPVAEHHLPPLVRPGHLGSVELHTAVLRGRWQRLLPVADLLQRSAPAASGPGRRLHPDDAVAILVAHAQLQDEGRVLLELPLRALHETALLLTGDEPVDWAVVAQRLAGAGGRVLPEHLYLTEALLGPSPPVAIPAAARRRAGMVLAVADRPRARAALGQAAFVPRSLSAERMVAIHGGRDRGVRLWATRARHVAAGVVRRLRRG